MSQVTFRSLTIDFSDMQRYADKMEADLSSVD